MQYMELKSVHLDIDSWPMPWINTSANTVMQLSIEKKRDTKGPDIGANIKCLLSCFMTILRTVLTTINNVLTCLNKSKMFGCTRNIPLIED